MKKALLVLSIGCLLLFGVAGSSSAQEEPKPKKDTVNMDTDAKPKFYYSVEDDNKAAPAKANSTILVVIIGAAAVTIGVVAYMILKKKK